MGIIKFKVKSIIDNTLHIKRLGKQNKKKTILGIVIPIPRNVFLFFNLNEKHAFNILTVISVPVLLQCDS